MRLPLTELEINNETFFLTCDSPFLQKYFAEVLPESDIWRTMMKAHWSLSEACALFFAATQATDSKISPDEVATIVTDETVSAVRVALLEAASAAIDELLRGQRYVM